MTRIMTLRDWFYVQGMGELSRVRATARRLTNEIGPRAAQAMLDENVPVLRDREITVRSRAIDAVIAAAVRMRAELVA